MTTLEEAAALSRDESGLTVVSTLRADNTIQASLVNAGVLQHPPNSQDQTIRSPGSPTQIGCGCCCAISSPLPAAPTMIGTPTTARWWSRDALQC